MRNIKKALVILLLLTIISCNKNAEAESVKVDAADKNVTAAPVTFIELGSVDCVPCKMMQPIMDQVEIDFAESVDVVFHDVWTEAGKPYATQYKINAIPTQIFLDAQGNEYYRHIGFFPQDELYAIIEQGLEK